VHSPFPIDETFGARVENAYRFGAEPRWDDGRATLLAQIEPLLGEGAEPDATFFIESWTVGVAAAAENFERRQQDRQPEPEAAAWPSFSAFLPFFMNEPAAFATPEESPSCGDGWDELEMEPEGNPLTLEAACRLLGVAVDSTREQLKAAYRRMASRYHPDHRVRSGFQEQKLASDRMAAINAAYRMLCESRLG
jgi:DnaJ-domain-containing protein 1